MLLSLGIAIPLPAFFRLGGFHFGLKKYGWRLKDRNVGGQKTWAITSWQAAGEFGFQGGMPTCKLHMTWVFMQRSSLMFLCLSSYGHRARPLSWISLFWTAVGLIMTTPLLRMYMMIDAGINDTAKPTSISCALLCKIHLIHVPWREV